MERKISMATSEKINFFKRALWSFFFRARCPYCGEISKDVIDRKYLFIRLFRCPRCNLYYRFPVDSKSQNNRFYQKKYKQRDAITTDLPDLDTLNILLTSNFSNTNKSVSTFSNIFGALYQNIPLSKLSLIDYGASWGYMSYQFKNTYGMDVQAFEISKPRADYGKTHLAIDIKTTEALLNSGVDIFFSSHVIEHHPDINAMIQTSMRLLKEEGLFIAECPNGSLKRKNENPALYKKGWGLVHPNYLNESFYSYAFRQNPYFITTSPYSLADITNWDKKTQVIHGTLNGDNILVFALPNKLINQ